MTDKQIIIDGCDVSGCRYFEDGECLNPCETVSICELSPNCNYKQLKRKEQECGQLKCLLEGVQKSLEVEIEERSKWSQLETEVRYELLCKEQECEELKKNYFTVIQQRNVAEQQLDQLKAENKELKNRVAELSLFQLYKIQRDEAEKTLTEIKEIAEKQCVCGVDCIDMKQILQKISECEGNNE